MNITYLIGTILAFLFMIMGMIQGDASLFDLSQIGLFANLSSLLIVVGCTFAVVVASFPVDMIKSLPKHFSIMLNVKKYNPMVYIDELVELAQVARKNGLLSLEERANNQQDPFFKQAIMLIVDANDPDKVRAILNNDIEVTSARHDSVVGMYEKAAAISPAFGMVGTLIGLIKMLATMNPEAGGSSEIGPAMSIALITTLYGCILAHMVFTPIATNLANRDEEEMLCKMIIVEGILSIQSGENPKFLKEKLLTYMTQKDRDSALGQATEGKASKKEKKKVKES